MKVDSQNLLVGDRFTLKDEITRHKNVYEITSEQIPITNPNFTHWVQYECKAVSFKPGSVLLEKTIFLRGNLIDIERK